MYNVHNVVSPGFLSGRVFIYEYECAKPLEQEMTQLAQTFFALCRDLWTPYAKFINSSGPGWDRTPKRFGEGLGFIKFDRLPTRWPNQDVVWRAAVQTCPHHMFDNTSALSSRFGFPPQPATISNYLLYGCDPSQFDAHYKNGKPNHKYNWEALFAHAVGPKTQLNLMVGIDMMFQAQEYNIDLLSLHVLPLLLQQVDAQRRLIRRLPNNSVSNWTDYAPPKEWQLLQALVRYYLASWDIGPFWLPLIEYTGVEYSRINNMLRQQPALLDVLTTMSIYSDEAVNMVPEKFGRELYRAWHIQWLMALLPPLPRPCIVYRYHTGTVGDTFGPLLHPNDPGARSYTTSHIVDELREKGEISIYGFTSTSINLNYVLSKLVDDEPRHILEIYLPQGTHCCSWPSQEFELILPHRAVMKFVHAYYIGTSYTRATSAYLPEAQQDNLTQVCVLVFQLVYDGIAFADDGRVPEFARRSAMPVPSPLQPAPPRRHASFEQQLPILRENSATAITHHPRRRTLSAKWRFTHHRRNDQRLKKRERSRQYASVRRSSSGSDEYGNEPAHKKTKHV